VFACSREINPLTKIDNPSYTRARARARELNSDVRLAVLIAVFLDTPAATLPSSNINPRSEIDPRPRRLYLLLPNEEQLLLVIPNEGPGDGRH